jgi:exonuclease III
MRSHLINVELVIIDEISMINQSLMTYINGRLQQIKQTTGRSIYFGNAAILAVGDFYQLPPVIPRPLYVQQNSVDNCWHLFSLWELTTIMRQKDDLPFAQLLNRLRILPKNQPMLKEDHAMLLSVVQKQTIPEGTLCIYPTRREVHSHNQQQLQKHCTNIHHILPLDIRKAKSKTKPSATNQRKQTLIDLHLALDARVMLIQNIDVADGLVNGSRGTITKIAPNHPQTNRPQFVCVSFDDPNTGKQTRKKQTSQHGNGIPKNAVIIKQTPMPEQPRDANYIRHQFPLMLAWACTAHKVQGMTTSSAAVSLQKTFKAGQAYVALSRVTSLQGLHLLDDKLSKIYCDTSVTTALQNMPPLDVSPIQPITHLTIPHPFIIAHHNIGGLQHHFADLQDNTEIQHANIICLTETWLTTNDPPPSLNLPHHNLHNIPRSYCYDKSDPYATKQHSGVGAYISTHLHHNTEHHKDLHLEHYIIHTQNPSSTIVIVYRPPKYHTPAFVNELQCLLQRTIQHTHHPVIALGDYNIDYIQQPQNPITATFEAYGFTQMLQHTTTKGHTLLDHIYQRSAPPTSVFNTCHTHYSYHITPPINTTPSLKGYRTCLTLLKMNDCLPIHSFSIHEILQVHLISANDKPNVPKHSTIGCESTQKQWFPSLFTTRA